uniref:F-box domain-containing protein n=1 Tax=Steinernema glaseri TaxID=37863 RepID=A0A1I7Y452_9BILA
MDAVPWKFVDSVVELFSKKTMYQLAPEVAHPLWKAVVDLHHRNRVYDTIFLRVRESGKYLFVSGEHERPFNLQALLKNRRFARFVEISDEKRDMQVTGAKPLGIAETGKLLITAASQISGLYLLYSTKSTRVILMSLFKRVYLQTIRVLYCGQIAYDFLEHQINNSPILNCVVLGGSDWPQSSARLITNFCLRGKPGNGVAASVHLNNIYFDSSCIENILDLWKMNGKLNFFLQSRHCIISEMKWIRIFLNQVHLKYRVFKHRTEKSIAILSNDGTLMEFYTCGCDRFKQCILKTRYSDYHNF